jgi:hypothetical protein
LGEGAHFDPVPEQHNHDQQRQLPPEVQLMIENPEAGPPRRQKSHRDGQTNQQHHPRLTRFHLVNSAREERAAAPHIHHRAEHGRDPTQSGDARQRVTENHREHVTEQHHRDSDQQHDPEQSTELPYMISVPGVPFTFSMAGVVIPR